MSRHPESQQIALLALEGGEANEHVRSCPECAEALRDLSSLIAGLGAMLDPPKDLVAGAKRFFTTQRRLEALLERMTRDAALRARAATDPAAVLRDAGLEPNEAMITMLSAEETGRSRSEPEQRLAARRLWT